MATILKRNAVMYTSLNIMFSLCDLFLYQPAGIALVYGRNCGRYHVAVKELESLGTVQVWPKEIWPSVEEGRERERKFQNTCIVLL